MNVYDNYECDEQMSIFDILKKPYVNTKPIALIEAFGGIGSQAMALRDLGAVFKHHMLIEYDKFPVASYNSIFGTDFKPMDIREVHAEDLRIDDKEHFTYLLTYSFPCQDLSCSGKGRGMSREQWERGESTRSGLLWEVERILRECVEQGKELPDLLIMENVIQVHSQKNLPDFQKWQEFLASIGYSNYWQDLSAAEYADCAQSRTRCFMVSILGNYTYKFPAPVPLTKCMRDYLEDVVDDKYYIRTQKAKDLIDKLVQDGAIDDKSNKLKSVGCMTDKYHQSSEVFLSTGLSRCIDATIGRHPERIVEVIDESWIYWKYEWTRTRLPRSSI